MLNRAVLVGRLTKDPELRYTTSGTANATFTVAVNRQFNNKDGEREADFISCVVWRKGAEIFTNYTHKGSLVALDGRIQTRNYENKQGQRVYITEVIVENFSFLDPKGNNQDKQKAKQDDDPFANAQAEDPFKSDRKEPIDISDDNLPF